MQANEFQQEVMRTFNKDLPENEALAMVGMGLAGEAGEVVDELKKVLFHKKTFNKEKVIEELSDILWYCGALAELLGTNLEAVFDINSDKLRKRYPSGFDAEKSNNRTK